MNYKKLSRLFLLSLILCCPLALSGCYEKPIEKKEAEAVPVRTAEAQLDTVQLYGYFTGNTAVDPVNIVPRIRGYLEEIKFNPGDIVEEGAVLFTIEQFDYKTSVEKAKGNLNIATANAAQKKADYDRELELQAKGPGFTTQADIDRTKALWDEALGQIDVKKADLADAEKQLERTVIKAPFRGKISRNLVEKGNLVDGSGSNPPTLATLNAMDPMYVYFQVSDSEFLNIQQMIVNEVKKILGDKYSDEELFNSATLLEIAQKEKLEMVISFEMRLLGQSGDPNSYPYSGIIDYSDNTIDMATGTNMVRGRIKNPNYVIYPGLVCRVKIPGKVLQDAIFIQEKAISHDLSEIYVWVLDEKGLPQRRTIKIGERLEDGRVRVLSGLNSGERYVVDGVQKVRAGAPITEMAPEESGATSADEPTQAATPQEPAPAPAPQESAAPAAGQPESGN
ncbi:MAG: efflux RND transporter periplasmic adaptor subunit [Planctomycetia bacterium]|nr:efflux RND transporter periplasmic adaptor subunit [Planctomycetia bacterium]